MEKCQIMFDLMEKLNTKMDKHTEILSRLEVNVDRNSADLETHIKRSDLIEERLDFDKQELIKRIEVLEQPSLVAKFISNKIVQLSGISAALLGFVTLFKYVKSLFL